MEPPFLPQNPLFHPQVCEPVLHEETGSGPFTSFFLSLPSLVAPTSQAGSGDGNGGKGDCNGDRSPPAVLPTLRLEVLTLDHVDEQRVRTKTRGPNSKGHRPRPAGIPALGDLLTFSRGFRMT